MQKRTIFVHNILMMCSHEPAKHFPIPPVFDKREIRIRYDRCCSLTAMIHLRGSISHYVMLKGQAYRQHILRESGRAFDVG